MSPMSEASDSLPPGADEPARVRPARIRDWPRLLDLLHSSVPELDEDLLSRWLRDERHSLVVAIGSSGLVGFARLVIDPLRQASCLECLVVQEAARGQGVGTALLHYCEEVARACGAQRIRTSIASDDLPSRAFCAHHGFTEPCGPAVDGRQALARRVAARQWPPLWDLRRLHAPRVPPAALERAATRVLFDAWLGRSLRQRPVAPAATSKPWPLISPVASGSAGA